MQVSVLGDTPESGGFDGKGFTALADYLGGMGPNLAACFDRGGGDLHVSEVAARLRVVLDVLPASTRRRLDLVLLDEALSELVREASLATDPPRSIGRRCGRRGCRCRALSSNGAENLHKGSGGPDVLRPARHQTLV